MKRFKRCVPVVREAIQYLVRVSESEPKERAQVGEQLLKLYHDPRHAARHLEYARMYLLHPFTIDKAWNNVQRILKLREKAVDEFSIRKLTLALGRAGQEFWFRGRKQALMGWACGCAALSSTALPACRRMSTNTGSAGYRRSSMLWTARSPTGARRSPSIHGDGVRVAPIQPITPKRSGVLRLT